MTGPVVDLNGQRLELLPERAVFWPATATLLLADLHLGKAARFRRAGLAVPEGDNQATLARVDALIEARRPATLILLGDILHASLAADPALRDTLLAWRAGHPTVEMIAIVGNHDRDIRGLEPALLCAAEGLLHHGLSLRHHPPEGPVDTPWLAGHWHPVVRLSAAGDSLRLPAFVEAPDVGLVLPAFGGLTGGALIDRRAGRRRYVTSGEGVFAVDRG
ncbi:hypothetical protein BA899_08915 [Spiribacter sp. SSL99]|uniref:ligase-associated DNA damage response endonuclease PdeM n=1 Tax=Spiribacter sp. SSL99 TaxID=1866884 RepID=UPI0013309704|nr:ligase-associated DNA damage response endonuclease PdeM [Spiribacter sp. SSL99]KAF0286461.1 hypothetical protein BA899_08915 [Spiribacter sp. SSL99]